MSGAATGVQQATGRLLPVVKDGDKAALASAYAAVDAGTPARAGATLSRTT